MFTKLEWKYESNRRMNCFENETQHEIRTERERKKHEHTPSFPLNNVSKTQAYH